MVEHHLHIQGPESISYTTKKDRRERASFREAGTCVRCPSQGLHQRSPLGRMQTLLKSQLWDPGDQRDSGLQLGVGWVLGEWRGKWLSEGCRQPPSLGVPPLCSHSSVVMLEIDNRLCLQSPENDHCFPDAQSAADYLGALSAVERLDFPYPLRDVRGRGRKRGTQSVWP